MQTIHRYSRYRCNNLCSVPVCGPVCDSTSNLSGFWEHGAIRAYFYGSCKQAGDGGLFSVPVCRVSSAPVYVFSVSKPHAGVHASLDLDHDASARESWVSQRPVSDYVHADAPSHGLLLYASAAAPSDAGIQASAAALLALKHFSADHEALVSQRPVSGYVLSGVPYHGLLLYASAAASSGDGQQASAAAPSGDGLQALAAALSGDGLQVSAAAPSDAGIQVSAAAS